MSTSSINHEIETLFSEKKIPYSLATIRFIRHISLALKERGIGPDREILDFVIDVLRAMAYVNITSDDSLDTILTRREELTAWLEVMGWRRCWFDS